MTVDWIADLESTVRGLLVPAKGILAADESLPTIERRFSALGIPSTEETRRAYRAMLFTTPGLGAHISGAILFDETIHQRTVDGVPLPEPLTDAGIIPGIKVDTGLVALVGFPGEQMTEGLDGLGHRLVEYRELGARFTKWRAVVAVGDHTPTDTCMQTNARGLALFAALSQQAGLVPIVELEVLMKGHHTLSQCAEAATATWQRVFAALAAHRVVLEHMLVKTGMMVPGTDCPEPAGVAVVAETTVRVLRRVVPAAVPGIVFLSGGQRADAATARLEAICSVGQLPWRLSFSFGRALQDSAMAAWRGAGWHGLPGHVAAAQDALRRRAQCNGAAIQGRTAPAIERLPVSAGAWPR
jgi:fructose-bisphosphate aldolase class I